MVKPTYEKIPATNAVKLIFTIDEGPKVKVGHDHLPGQPCVFRPQDSPLDAAIRRPYAIPM